MTHTPFLLALCVAAVAAPGTACAGKSKLALPLNDTGMVQCLVGGVFTTDCTGTGQDAESGRDVDKPALKDGWAGFSYAKVCNSGELAGTGTCPAKPVLGGGPDDWACTQDKITKLIWEVKTTDGGLRDWTKSYTDWGDGSAGDASEFVAQVNAQGLCGAHDWRLPTVAQLQGLVNYGVVYPGPTVDINWLPRTRSDLYWTGDGLAGHTSSAWVVAFYNGYVLDTLRRYSYPVRLVRSGQ